MPYEIDDGLSKPRGNRIDNDEHEASAVAKRVLIVGEQGEELLSLVDGQLRVYQADDMTGLLNSIVKEMKITNLHLAILTDNIIDKTEVV